MLWSKLSQSRNRKTQISLFYRFSLCCSFREKKKTESTLWRFFLFWKNSISLPSSGEHILKTTYKIIHLQKNTKVKTYYLNITKYWYRFCIISLLALHVIVLPFQPWVRKFHSLHCRYKCQTWLWFNFWQRKNVAQKEIKNNDIFFSAKS